MKRGEDKPRDDAADEAEFGPRLEAARRIRFDHAGCVEITTDKSGRIVARLGSKLVQRRSAEPRHHTGLRTPRVFKDPFFGEARCT